MEIRFGLDAALLEKGKEQDVFWSSQDTVNPHILVTGVTGSGKTYFLRKVVNNLSHAAKQSGSDVKIHVFDVHGDVKCINESTVLFSETSGFGINPLELNPSPVYGGVRKKIESFLEVLQKSTSVLGARQKSVLSDLLEDLYSFYGFIKEDPNTWSLDDVSSESSGVVFLDVPFAERANAKKLGCKWNPSAKAWYVEASNYTGAVKSYPVKEVESLAKRYPTLSDAVSFIKNKMEESFVGVGRESSIALRSFHRATSSYNKLLAETFKGESSANVKLSEDEKAKIEEQAEKVKIAVDEYLSSYGSERTLRDAIQYTSLDMMTSIYQRMKSMLDTGIFKDTPPPFDPNEIVDRHDIRALSHEEQKMHVFFHLNQLFDDALEKGETDQLRHVIVVDEAYKFFDDEPRNPLNVIALEGRKFGLQLVCASQTPGHFSEHFLSSVATKVILGLDEMHWEQARRKLNIPLKTMAAIAPRKQMLAQIKRTGSTKNPWQMIKI